MWALLLIKIILAGTHVVTTGDELINQFKIGEDSVIIVNGQIDLQGAMIGPVNNQNYDLTIIGTPGSSIKSGVYDWSNKNLMSVRCKNFVMIGLELTDYESIGQAIGLQDVKTALIVNCSFKRIGRVVYPATMPVSSAKQTVYTQAIGGWGGNADVHIVNCLFEDVCGNQLSWSHPIYLMERSIVVSNCTFRRCGGAVALQSTVTPIFANNTVEDSVIANNRYNIWEYPDFWYCGGNAAILVGNKVTGSVRWLWASYCDNVFEVGNDYTGATPINGIKHINLPGGK